MTILLVSYSFFTNDLPFMRAAGVGTGAPDINARYLDGYGTATSSVANKVLITDAQGNLPQPTGSIMMFNTNCPTGWTRISALDGKFLVGGESYNVATGGADSITLTTANMPAHTHTGTTASDGAHTHTASYVSSNAGVGSYYSMGRGLRNDLIYTTTTSSNGAHTHTFTTGSTGSGTAFDNRPAYATIVICEKD